ncbi:MAG: Fic family protein [Pelobium sp.]
MYIHQRNQWPQFLWDNDTLISIIGEVRNLQGKVLGKMEAIGFKLRDEASLEMLSKDVLKSSEIEGEIFELDEVRSSVARHLGMEISGLIPSDRNVDGMVEMILDATQNHTDELNEKRLFSWHSSLFSSGKSGLYKIIVGNWRDDSTGPMQVVSGALGKEKVHFEAPSASKVPKEMEVFFNWVNTEKNLDPVIKAAIAHFWFLTIHPFEDGNGRIARAISDSLIARAEGVSQRFYSFSTQIRIERKVYYAVLEKTQRGDLDITLWISWFLNCLKNAIKAADETLAKVLFKHDFWNKNAKTVLNSRQVLILNKLMDGFEGKLNTSKWAKIAKCSADTALRDIQDLIKKEILKKVEAGGRSTNYELINF